MLIKELRRHMDEEEAELFPMIEGILGDKELVQIEELVSLFGLHEDMTVNRIIRQHPETLPFFNKLFINIALEGPDCLNEVAWRHGVECRDLLVELEALIPSERYNRLRDADALNAIGRDN